MAGQEGLMVALLFHIAKQLNAIRLHDPIPHRRDISDALSMELAKLIVEGGWPPDPEAAPAPAAPAGVDQR